MKIVDILAVVPFLLAGQVLSAPGGGGDHHNIGLKPADSGQVFCKTTELYCSINRVRCGETFYQNKRYVVCSKGAREWLMGCRINSFDAASIEDCYKGEASLNQTSTLPQNSTTSINQTPSLNQTQTSFLNQNSSMSIA